MPNYRKPTLNINSLLAILSVFNFCLLFSGVAEALPSFSRQTGEACTECHTQAFGPNLTPYGRDFKLQGYTRGGGDDSLLSRLGGMAQGSVTNLKKDDPTIGNNNLVLDQASVFYGGKVYGQMGAFIQTTYDGVANQFFIDNTDIRLSDDTDLFDQDIIYGVSFNNNPTAQDLWNTTPAWGFPYIGSHESNTPAAGPLIGNVGGQVGGASLYTMIDGLVYLEAGAYSSFAKYAQKGMGEWDNGAIKIDGGAPYWRFALQQEWQGHYLSIGQFGFKANVQPNVLIPGTDRYTDLGADFNYQYLANVLHIYEFKASYIREQQQLLATYNQGGAMQPNQQQGFLGLNASYTYSQTYTFATGFNHIYGGSDALLYASPTNRPNSEYFTFELDYVPFGKTVPTGLNSYLNLRFAAQYVAYTLFDGAVKNYDGTGRSASDNNTLYFNSWLSF
jgi:hypothetical protein